MTGTARAPLLAKSRRGTKELSLLQHLCDTERAATSLFRAGTRWAHTYPRFFKLEPEQYAAFLLHLRLAALFHDIGKANEDFQTAMGAKGFKPQSLRHEHLSALLLCEPSMAAWLSTNASIDVDIVVAAVLSHHLKAARDGEWEVLLRKHATPTRLFFDDDQVGDALLRVAEVGNLAPFAGAFPAVRYFDAAWTPAWESLFERADRFASQLRKHPARLRLCLAVKAGLVVCDSVSSGLWREDREIEYRLGCVEATNRGTGEKVAGLAWIPGWRRIRRSSRSPAGGVRLRQDTRGLAVGSRDQPAGGNRTRDLSLPDTRYCDGGVSRLRGSRTRRPRGAGPWNVRVRARRHDGQPGRFAGFAEGQECRRR